jgi:hypothetical protein
MKTQRAERLRTTVDFLPPDTKRAMLEGLERNRIITGANTDRRGGMCPMIAADRNAFESGPMADIFAAVWDSYNGACILNRRDASERDLRTLKTMLETSLANSPEFSSELGQAWLDYHVGADPGNPGSQIDFDQELTDALKQSALLDTASLAAVSPAIGPAPAAAAPRERKVELVYDGGPVPQVPAAAPRATRPTAHAAGHADPTDTEPADTRPAATRPAATRPAATRPAETRAADTQPAPGIAMNSSYEPYRVAAKRRAPQIRASVDASIPARTRAAQHAAQTNASAERAKARAVIANQAATLRGRDWPRPADGLPQTRPAAAGAAARPTAVEVPRPETTATPFEAPTIRQAAIPQVRSAASAAAAAAAARAQAPAGARVDRPQLDEHPAAEPAGRTGWSLLPPYRSFDDYAEPGATAGPPQPGPTDVPEVQPPEGDRRPVHM